MAPITDPMQIPNTEKKISAELESVSIAANSWRAIPTAGFRQPFRKVNLNFYDSYVLPSSSIKTIKRYLKYSPFIQFLLQVQRIPNKNINVPMHSLVASQNISGPSTVVVYIYGGLPKIMQSISKFNCTDKNSNQSSTHLTDYINTDLFNFA